MEATDLLRQCLQSQLLIANHLPPHLGLDPECCPPPHQPLAPFIEDSPVPPHSKGSQPLRPQPALLSFANSPTHHHFNGDCQAHLR